MWRRINNSASSTIALGNGVENPVVFGKGLTWPIGRGGKLDAVHAHQLIKLAAEHLAEGAIAAALNDPVMKIEVAFLLVIADSRLKRRVALMGVEHAAQLIYFRLGHALGGQPTGHAFQRFANFVKLDQFGMTERDHTCADVRHTHLKPMDRFAQRTATDAVGARQLGLGNLAARSDFTFDDGRLNTSKNVLGQGFRIVCACRCFLDCL